MSVNDFSVLSETVAPYIEDTLRKKAGLFKHVRSDFGLAPERSGSTMNVIFPAAVTARAITASPSGTSAPTITPTKVGITLDQWYEAPFQMSVLEMLGNDALIQQQTVAAVEGLMAQVELDLYQKIASGSTNKVTTYAATSLGILSSSISPLITARNNLSTAKAPPGDRCVVLGVSEFGNLLLNTQLQKINESQDPAFLREGDTTYRLSGFDIFESQWQISNVSGTINPAFHRDAVGIVVRPGNAGPNTRIFTDPVSGFPVVLSMFQQEYQQKLTISALWGTKQLRADFSTILYG